MSFDDTELAAVLTVQRALGGQPVEVLPVAPGEADPARAAAAYAARGWPVMPLHTPDGAGACSCRRGDCTSPGKHPRTLHGLSDASTEHEQVATWWRMWPGANVGVATGAGSGLVVIDVDPRHGGADSLAELETVVGPLPGTATGATGGGGCHLFYEHHRIPGWGVPSHAEAFGGAMPGLDVRADGGYVVAPPSRHASGRRYGWCGPWAAQLAPWPLALMWRYAPRPATRPAARGGWAQLGGAVLPSASGAAAALAGACRRMAGCGAGNRNHLLNWAAFHLAARVCAGHLDAALVEHELGAAARTAGLGEREIAATIRSAFTAAGCGAR